MSAVERFVTAIRRTLAAMAYAEELSAADIYAHDDSREM